MNSPSLIPDDHLFRVQLQEAISRVTGRPVAIATIERRPFDGATAFRSEIVKLVTQDGERLRIYLKDFAHTRLPKPGLAQRRERERLVYRDLLSQAHLGTAQYCGAVWDESRDQYWLLIEFVPGVELRTLGFTEWVMAAAWLGRLHGTFMKQFERGNANAFLVRHDAAFFHSMANRALDSVSGYSAALSDRLTSILGDYGQIVEAMILGPHTLVHGSFRPQNIIVDLDSTPPRVAPIDWELAAAGVPIYDLAFIADGFRPPKLQVMLNAYIEEATKHGFGVPVESELIRLINCFRLHKTVKSLSDSVMLGFREETVIKLVNMADEISRRIPR